MASFKRNKLRNQGYILIVVIFFVLSIAVMVSLLRLSSNERLLLVKSIRNKTFVTNNLESILSFVLNFSSNNLLSRLDSEDSINIAFPLNDFLINFSLEKEKDKISLDTQYNQMRSELEDLFLGFNLPENLVSNILVCLEDLKSNNDLARKLDCFLDINEYFLYVDPVLIDYITICRDCFRLKLTLEYKGFKHSFLGIFKIFNNKPEIFYFHELPNIKISSQK